MTPSNPKNSKDNNDSSVNANTDSNSKKQKNITESIDKAKKSSQQSNGNNNQYWLQITTSPHTNQPWIQKPTIIKPIKPTPWQQTPTVPVIPTPIPFIDPNITNPLSPSFETNEETISLENSYDKDLTVKVHNDRIAIGNIKISLQRTLRIPDDNKNYPLPPSMGTFPLRKVADYKDKVPSLWETHESAFFIPIYQREALWISFEGLNWRPNALQVIAGGINAVSGKPDKNNPSLDKNEQNFVLVPTQPWLDGWNNDDDKVRQFVAMPLGEGYTAEEQMLGTTDEGTIRFRVFDPHDDVFTEPEYQLPTYGSYSSFSGAQYQLRSSAASYALAEETEIAGAIGMGLGSGGKINQEIYKPEHDFSVWNLEKSKEVVVYLVNSLAWYDITGEPMPKTTVSAEAYNNAGFPFFDYYKEDGVALPGSAALDNLKTTKEIDEEKGLSPQQNDNSIKVAKTVRLKGSKRKATK